MKRLLLAFVAVFFLISVGPLPVASARSWWPHSHRKGSPAVTKQKGKKSKASREEHGRSNSDPLYSVPRSVGWWHKQPGPAGAGVN